MTDRLCVFCKHFKMTHDIDRDGMFLDVRCDKDHWHVATCAASPEMFRNHIKKAVDCPDWEVVE